MTRSKAPGGGAECAQLKPAVGFAHNFAAKPLQHHAGHVHDGFLVVHKENAAMAGGKGERFLFPGNFAQSADGEKDMKNRALAGLAVDGDRPAAVLDYPMHHGRPHARSFHPDPWL
jgi:hypothetical protein